MQALILFLAFFVQNPSPPDAPTQGPDVPTPAGPTQAVLPDAPPTTQPPVPGKTMPAPQAPVKTMPAPQAPVKTMPAPQAPVKTMPAPQAPVKTMPAPQAPVKTMPAPQASVFFNPAGQTAQEELGPDQQVYIQQYGGYCVGQQVTKGSPDAMGKWRVKYRVSTPQGNYTYKATGTGTQSYAQYGNPAGGQAGAFLSMLNSTRARHGLSAVGYDQNLTNQAAVNNNHQQARGIGHFYMGSARRQNAAMGQSVDQVHNMWMNSPGHRAAMLDPNIRAVGLAQNGQWWTMNAY